MTRYTDDELREVVKENIKRLREKKGVSMRKMASETGISHTLISRYEQGEVCPNIKGLPALANYFGVSIAEMVSAPGEWEGRIERRTTKKQAQPL